MFNREIGEYHFNQHKSFINFLKNKDVSGSFLFVGQESIGKKDFAALLCEHIFDNSSKVFNGTHPDVFFLDKGSEKILVEDIDKLDDWTFNKPFEAIKKIVIIQSAENMNLTAQNKLLKVLEEPPEYLFFFLLTSNNSILLPTVDSRCIKINLNPLSESMVRDSIKSKFSNEDLLITALFILNGSYDKENIYNDDYLFDIVEFSKILILKDAASLDKCLDLIDKFFKMKISDYKILNSIIRVLVLILKLKYEKNNKNNFLSINLGHVSSYNITDLVNCLESLNSSVKGTSLNLRMGLEELILDFLLNESKLNKIG